MFLNEINIKIIAFCVFFVSFFITYITIPTIIRMARFKNLFDKIDKRKVHIQDIPRLGGVAIFAGFIISILIFIDSRIYFYLGPFVAGLFIIFFLGLKDDILVISPFTKFIGQIIAATIIIIPGNTIITNFHGFFGISEIHLIIGFLASLLIFLVTTNAFNFIDGIDGLSASLGCITSLAFGIWFLLVGQIHFFLISLSASASLLAFIRFNLFSKNNKIFMGDTGSMIIGFVFSFLIIQFNEVDLSIKSTSKYFIYPAPAVAFGILIIPYFDMLRVIYIRLLQGKNIFKPDKNHIHHLMLRLGLSHKKITLIFVCFTILFSILIFWLSKYLTIRRLLLLELIIALLISFIPEYLVKKKEKSITDKS